MRLIFKIGTMSLILLKLMNPSVALADEIWFTPCCVIEVGEEKLLGHRDSLTSLHSQNHKYRTFYGVGRKNARR